MKRITDPDFEYVDSAHTNIRATFDRIRRELAELEATDRKDAGKPREPTQAEYEAADHAYDAAREDRVFGRNR